MIQADTEFEIKEKDIDIFLIAGYRFKGKHEDCGKAFWKVGKKFGRFISGKAINLYYDSEPKEDNVDIESCFPVRKGKSTNKISVRELKGGRAVTLIHKGRYENLKKSYGQLLSYISEKGYKKKLPSREVYLKGPGMIFKGNPDDYVTEIQIMIEE